jgi:hypothetical protein
MEKGYIFFDKYQFWSLFFNFTSYNNLIFYHIKLICHSIPEQSKTFRELIKDNPNRMRKSSKETKELLRNKF